MDFELILIVEMIALVRTADEKLLWAFKLYDTDNSGVIDRQEMRNIMEVQGFNFPINDYVREVCSVAYSFTTNTECPKKTSL